MITRHERLHPDVATFAATRLDATAMDQLLALGIAIEARRVSDAADPLAPHRLPSDRSLQRLQLRWGPPPATPAD